MRIHFGGSSRQSFVTARAKLDAAVKGASAASASELSSHLFFAADVLSQNTSIRRAFADPARDAASKGALVKDLFGKSLSATALEILTAVSTLRWSAAGDLVHVVEQLAIEAEASAANLNNELDRVEDELFEDSRTRSRKLRTTQSACRGRNAQAKTSLVTEVLSKKRICINYQAGSCACNQPSWSQHRGSICRLSLRLANRRNRLIAVIRVATEISDSQKSRLATAIEKQVGQPIRVNIEVEPSILGGVSVKFADELVDGSVSHRLASAGRALAGNK
jgi:F-type H+-transporting ATPase subunit delta